MASSHTPADLEGRLRQARSRLEAALRAGEDLRTEDLLAADPTLGADSETAVELIYTEFVLREQMGQSPAPVDWLTRFPAWRTDLEEVFQVHEMLGAAETVDDGPGGAAKDKVREIPRRVGDYEIDAELGRGGMGVVYRGRHRRLNRIVAVKVIISGSHAGARELERFRREAETAAQLDHPNIVRVYEVGEHEGRPFCAMEFVGGGTLGRRMDGSPWPPRPTAELVAVLARAVQHAHERGVVHRDLKPDNILMGGTPAGFAPSDGSAPRARPEDWGQASPKIADFGLAKRLDGSEGGPTRTGEVLGTPAYMAPEQAEGQSQGAGAAADVWALGVILYELLTGRAPFRGDSEADVLRSIRLDEPVSPRAVRPRLARDLDTICLKCLEKSPAARYATAAALADDLDRWLAGEPIRARPVGQAARAAKWMRRNPGTAAWLGGLLVMAVLSFAAVTTYAVRAEHRRGEADAARREAQRALYGQQVARAFFEWQTCNPEEAERLLESARAAGTGWEWSYVHGLCHSEFLTLGPHPETVAGVSYSPDGRVVATASGGWAGRRAGEIRLWDAASGRLLRTIGNDGHAPFVGLAYRPDGRVLATAGITFNSGRLGGLTCWDAETGAELGTVAGLEKGVYSVAFSPDGRWLAAGGTAGEVTLWDAETRAPVARLGRHRRGGVFTLAFSPDGTRLASGGWDGTVRIWDLRARREEQTLEAKADVRGVAFSPDGRYVAAAGYSNAVQVWKIGLDEPVAVHARHEDAATAVAFSPDGLYLASGDNTGMIHIYPVFSITARPRTLRGHSRGVVCLAFRADGLRLVTGGYDNTARVWDPWTPQEFGGLEAGQLPVATSLAYRPDGKRLATACSYSENRALPDAEVRVWNAETGTLDRTLHGHRDGVTGIAYSPDGTLLASSSADGTVRVWSPSDGATLAVFSKHLGPVRDVAFADAGRVVSVGKDGMLRAWDVPSRRELQSVDLGAGPLTRLAVHPGRGLIAAGAADGSVLWRDARTLGPIGADRLHRGPVEALAFHPAGRELASAGEDLMIQLRDMDRGSTRGIGPGHTGMVVGLSYSPDGHRLASASHDCSIRLWDPIEGVDKFSIRPQRGRVLSVAFRPGGRELAAGVQADGQVQFWGVGPSAEGRLARSEAAGLRWDRSSVAVALRDRRWEAAKFHLDRLVAAEPDRPAWRARRGEALAGMGRFDEAVDDFDLAAGQATIYYRALCRAAQGDRVGYQAICHELAESRRSVERSAPVNEAAWTCALRPDSGVEPAEIVALAERAVALNRNAAEALNTLGIALFRAGRFEEAAARLRESIAQQAGTGSIEDWLALAMVQHRQGRQEDARRSLDRAAALEHAEPAEGPGSPHWSERLAREMLRAEAGALPGSPSQPTP